MSKLKRIKQQVNIVFNSRFLRNLSPSERYEFLQLCHRRSYKVGEYVFYRNDPGTGMYFIEEGKIELTLEPNDDQAEDLPKDGFLLDPPESFGALSIGYNLRRRSTAKCLTDCTLLGFFKPDFEVLRDRQPQIAVKFLQTLTNIALRQLEQATKAIEEISDHQTALKVQFDAFFEEQKEE